MQKLFYLLNNLIKLSETVSKIVSESVNHKYFFKYGIAAILLVVALYPKFPVFNIPGTYVAVRAEDFLIIALSLVLLREIIKSGVKEFFEDRLNLAIVLFFVAGGLSLLSAMFVTHSVALHLGLLHWGRRIEYIIPFFIAIQSVKSGQSRFFIQTLLVASVIAFLYGFGQVYFQFPVFSTQNEEYSKGLALRWIPGARLPSTFSGHYDLAAFLVMVFPILFAYLFTLKKYSEKLILLTFLAGPLFWLFLKTESRVSFVGYLLGVSLTLWLIKKKLFIVPFLFVSVIGMFLLSGLGARYMRGINEYKERILNQNLLNFEFPKPVFAAEEAKPATLSSFGARVLSTTTEDRSTSIRLNIEWPRAIRAFEKNPLLGTGYSSISLATDNDYLRSLGEVGLVGTLAFLLVFLRIFQGFKRFLHNTIELNIDKAFVSGFLGAFVGFIFNASFIDVFEASKAAIIFWTLAGIAVGIVKYKKPVIT